MDIFIYFLLVLLSFSLGIIFSSIYYKKVKSYVGTIVVNYDEESEKLIYSLELDGEAENLQYEDEVTFRVEAPDKSLIRE